jgi:predicted PurR-regulated permease PerM
LSEYLTALPHAVFFGFIASVLTFIPYVGIMAASLLPIAVSWLTYDSVWYPIGVIVVFSIVQYLEANVIFPIAVGNRLHVNALLILVVIITGGILWGASGMILFVPYVGILKLIADRTEGWESLATLLGDKKK